MKRSARIKLARRKIGLSQQALANALGVTRSSVSNWEATDGGAPTIANLSKLATMAQVSFEWLATGRGPMLFAHDPQDDIPATDCDLIDDPQERRLVHSYRLASARMRIILLELIEDIAALRSGKRVSPQSAGRFLQED